ncbi:helix-turn-helix transcriptional regulator [Streptomyces sp. NPDC002387]|uniref:helix-turn-helix transcriptional regulator n=1 Tax=unclassified Streptomyces TaxID=2593676 RepID=UPI0034345BF6
MPRKPRREPPPPSGCVWIDEAADHVGVTVGTLYNWRHLGRGPRSFTIGRRAAYRIADLDAYLEELYQAAVNPKPIPEMRPPEPRFPRQRSSRGRRGAV